MHNDLTKYCDTCNKNARLTEDGYCKTCGKHADNMLRDTVNIDYTLQCRCNYCGWQGAYVLAYNGPDEPASCYICERGVMLINN